MIKGKRVLAIIPARSGSKRISNKNEKLLAGKPLVTWTIEAAIEADHIDVIHISTDSPNIKKIGEKRGVDVPFMRPSTLATDTASTLDVVLYVIESYEKLNEKFDVVILLQPTSPLRSSKHINAALEQFNALAATSIISICEVDHSPLWANVVPENLSMDNFISEDIKNKRSQDLPKYFRINGAIYITTVDSLKSCKSLISESNSFGFIMDRSSSVDIDDMVDFRLAEVLLQTL